MIYCNDVHLLQKFLAEAVEGKPHDSHAVASARVKREFADTDQTELSAIQARARELFQEHCKEMSEKYCGEQR